MDKELDSKTPGDLLRIDPSEARILLDESSLPEKIELIMRVSGKQRQELILLASDSDEIVAAFPKEELFLAIKEIGAVDALPLIELSSPEQLGFMLDVDCWKRDNLRPEKIIEWLKILFACGEDKVASWLDTVDFDFLVLIFKTFTTVYKLDTDQEEQMEDDTAFSLDDLYFITFKEPGIQALLIRIIEIIREFQPALYFNLMESAIWDIKVETEENAYRWRAARLADQGVPTFYEAIEIYKPPAGQAKREKRVVAEPDSFSLPFDSKAAVPAYPLTAERSALLTRAMLSVSKKEVLDRVKHDWVYICNSVVMADVDNFDDLVKIKRSLRKAANYVNVGLESLSRGGSAEAAKVLESISLDEIFRTGYAQAVALRKKASSIISKGYLRTDLSPADEPWRSIIKGTLFKHPLYYCPNDPDQEMPGDYRDFSSCKEIDETMARLDETEAAGRLMQSRFPGYLEHLGDLPLERCNVQIITDLTWGVLLFTATVHLLLGKPVRFWPVTPSDLDSVYPILWSRAEQKGSKELSPQVIKEMEKLLLGQADAPDEYVVPAKRYLADIYRRIEQEMGFLVPPVDPRFISIPLIELPAGSKNWRSSH